MPLTMFLSGALVFFYWAWKADDPRGKGLFLALSGAAVGCAFLTKGFLAFAVPAAAVAPFMLWERRTGRLLRLAWIPALAALVIGLPWSVRIALREPDFWRQFFWEEHVRRFFSREAQHAEPFWYFLPILLAGALPWTLFAPAAAAGLNRERLKEPLIRFLLCWLLFPFLFFSLSRGKLGPYILPCLPPLAALIGAGVAGYLESGRDKAFVAGTRVLGFAFGACGLALVGGRLMGIRQFPYGRDEEWKWLILVAALAFGIGALWRAGRAGGAGRRLAWVCAAPCLLMAAAQFALPKGVEELRAPEAFLARNSGRVAPGAPLFARAAVLHAVAWHFKRADIPLLASTGEGSYGLGFADAKGREFELDDFARFVAQCPATRLVTAVMDREFYDEKQGHLPKAAYEDKNDAVVFAQYRGGTPSQ
jgi:4-amino-4-deoxy-L-arabinose transferase